MAIHFQFDPAKAMQMIGYVVARVGPVDKVALTKQLYIAERDHFIKHGYPITGDRLYAMPRGPVPSDREDTSTPIPYELILQFYGGDCGFRLNRPVVSPAMAAHMVYPFRGSEPDL